MVERSVAFARAAMDGRVIAGDPDRRWRGAARNLELVRGEAVIPEMLRLGMADFADTIRGCVTVGIVTEIGGAVFGSLEADRTARKVLAAGVS